MSSTSNFYFNSALTANTFNNPDTLHYGSPYATFLLGALDGSSQMIGGPVPDPHVRFYGAYIQDDWKLSPKITLNLGLRDEYETALYDPQHNFSQGLNLSAPVPEMQASPPKMPTAAPNIGGNKFRLVVLVHYNSHKVYIVGVFTHHEYDEGKWNCEC